QELELVGALIEERDPALAEAPELLGRTKLAQVVDRGALDRDDLRQRRGRTLGVGGRREVDAGDGPVGPHADPARSSDVARRREASPTTAAPCRERDQTAPCGSDADCRSRRRPHAPTLRAPEGIAT